MKNPKGLAPVAVLGIVLGIIVLGGAVYYAMSLSTNENTNTTTNESMEDDAMMEDKNTNDSMMEDTNTNTGDAMENKNTNNAMEDDAMEDDSTDPETQASAGEYKEYSSSAFAQASGKQRVLFFYAAWCPTCRPADQNIAANESQIPDDVVVFRTNYDNEDALKAKYGVTYQHTFVLVDENGNALKKWNGGDIDEIIENVT